MPAQEGKKVRIEKKLVKSERKNDDGLISSPPPVHPVGLETRYTRSNGPR
jgi:hypothetical protein